MIMSSPDDNSHPLQTFLISSLISREKPPNPREGGYNSEIWGIDERKIVRK